MVGEFFVKNRVKTVAFFQSMIYNIKAVCRDGGAVERARFEIVLCRNVYKGSNPFLCAKPKKLLVFEQTDSFFVRFYHLHNCNFSFLFYFLMILWVNMGRKWVNHLIKLSMISRTSAYSRFKCSNFSFSVNFPFKNTARLSCSGCV